MTEDVTVETVETPTPETHSRFNVRKYARPALITTAVVAGAVLLKRKLNANVDGSATLTVETNDPEN